MQATNMDPKGISEIHWRGAWLRAQLDGLPGLTDADPGAGSDWIARRTRRVQALDALVAKLVVMPDRPSIRAAGDGTRVRMLGITCTSTAGIEGALRNWLTRAAQVQAQ